MNADAFTDKSTHMYVSIPINIALRFDIFKHFCAEWNGTRDISLHNDFRVNRFKIRKCPRFVLQKPFPRRNGDTARPWTRRRHVRFR